MINYWANPEIMEILTEGDSSVWTWGRTSSLWGWWSTGTGCPGRLWSLLLWRYPRPAWTRSCAACCRWPCFGRRVGLDDPQSSLPTPTILWFLQPQDFDYTFIIIWVVHGKAIPIYNFSYQYCYIPTHTTKAYLFIITWPLEGNGIRERLGTPLFLQVDDQAISEVQECYRDAFQHLIIYPAV